MRSGGSDNVRNRKALCSDGHDTTNAIPKRGLTFQNHGNFRMQITSRAADLLESSAGLEVDWN